MKLLATLLLSLSLQGVQVSSPARAPHDKTQVRHAHKGTWYFAENGHAVYCYGPVMMVEQPDGNPQRVATFCQANQSGGEQTMVPLRD
ncbi:MAG TPA: hypothetical protein VMH85_16460 [Terriglobales bacterium]|nr:hypothetical protein [Terriglobales bacterium]